MQTNTKESLASTVEEAKATSKCNDNMGSGPIQSVGDLLSTAVTGVGGAVAAGVEHVTCGVGEAVSSMSAGVGGLVTSVGESFGGAVSGASQKVVRCITFPPQSYSSNLVKQDESPSHCKNKVVDIAITPRIEQPDLSCTIHLRSSKQSVREESESSMDESEEGSDDTSKLEAEGASICKELGITEELLNGSKGEMLSRLPDLEAKVRDLILDTQPGSGRRRVLVHTLIALREHSQSVQELAEIAGLVRGVSVCGHLLVPASGKRRSHCDVCTSSLWHLLNTAYECSACKLHVYSSCLRGIRRYCPASYFSCVPPTVSYQVSDLEGTNTSKTPPPSPSTVSRDSLLTHSSKSDRSSDSEAPVRSPKCFLPNGPVAHKSPLHVLQDLAIKAADDDDPHIERRSCRSPLRHRVMTSLSVLITTICPERGLSAQGFRCAECNQPITNRGRGEAEGEYGDQPPHSTPSLLLACTPAPHKSVAWSEPRLCHYSGMYFCPACHWGDCAVLPALVVHNWDFTPRPVSRCAFQLLLYCYRKPLLDLRVLNVHLFTLLQELCEVKKLREDLLLMKQYLCSCRGAVQERLLHRLASRQHFVDSPHLYSLQDLCDLYLGVLLPQLQAIHREYDLHIRTVCKVCQGRGHICLNCRADKDILYPFESRAVQCSDCYAVMHSECYNLQRTCTKCELQGRTGGASIIGAMGETATPVIKREDEGTRQLPTC
ncbi:putative zinc-RING and/or ribbon [Trinorchestia longiramus]|nr:putative zinc-RING and/or ribbon [Trinorchestia longiramus]